MKNKGYTLIELLATVVVLAVIMIIAIPIISNIIEYAKKMSFRNSVYSYIRSAETKYALNVVNDKNLSNVILVFSDGEETSSVYDFKLSYKGQKAKDGILRIDKGKIAVAIHNGKWCATKDYESDKVAIEEQKFEDCTLDITVEDGWIPVASASELNQIREVGNFVFGKGTEWEGTYESGLDKNYIQVKNIDLSDYKSGEGWNPIGYEYKDSDGKIIKKHFTGKYNGSYLLIKNLRIDKKSNTTNYLGLFGIGNAEFKQIVLGTADVNVELGMGENVGGLIGYMSGGSIASSFYIGKVTGGIYTGGMVGAFPESGVLNNLYVNADITGFSNAGGLAAIFFGQETNNSYYRGNVYGNDYVGGLIGFQYNGDGIITNSYAIGNVKSEAGFAGGIVSDFNGVKFANNYYKGNIEGRRGAGGLIAEVYNEDFEMINSYAESNIKSEGQAGGLAGEFRGKLIENSYYKGKLIANKEAGGLMSHDFNDHLIVKKVYVIGDITSKSASAGGFSTHFRGKELMDSYYKGNVMANGKASGLFTEQYNNNLVVRNVYAIGDITGENGSAGGFSTHFTGKELTNSYYKGNVRAHASASGLLLEFYNENLLIDKVHAIGKVESMNGSASGLINSGNIKLMKNSYFDGDVTSKQHAAGIASSLYSGGIDNSYAHGNIESKEGQAGGLISDFGGDIITKSYFKGNVKGIDNVGGLISQNISEGIIDKNFVIANVHGNNNVGGLIGFNTYNIKNAYVIGNVTGNNNVGGLIGISVNGNVSNTYHYGNIAGTGTNVGSLIWKADGSAGVVTNSYYSNPPNNGIGKFVTKEQMLQKETYENWDFDTIWKIENNKTPELK